MSVTLDDDDTVPGLREDGTPDPAYAASIGIVPVGPGRRSAAFAIDAAIFVVLLLPVLVGAVPLLLGMLAESPEPARVVAHPDFVLALVLYCVGQGLIVIYTIVQLAMHGVVGRTVGKSMLGIRSVNVATFQKPGFWRIVLRALVFSAAFSLIPYLGAIPFLLSPLWDREKRGRGWLDKVGRNWLIDVRRGLDPFDAKALRNARRALTAPTVAAMEELPSLATGTAWAGASFVPSARSSSGVVSHGPGDDAPQQWTAPEIGVAPPTPAAAPAVAQIPVTNAPPVPPLIPAPSAAPPAAPAVAAPGASSAALVFDDGVVLAVTGTGLLGRSPAAQPGEVVEHLYSIDDPERQLSKTHLAFGLDGTGVWVADRGSSNGTYITNASGATFALEPMKRTSVEPGSVVEIGARTFTIGVTP